MDKITDYAQQIMDDWKRSNKHLEGCQVFEFNTDTPLSEETIAKIKATKPDFADEIEIEEVEVDK